MALSTPQCALDHSLAPWWTMDGAEPNVRAQFSRIFAVDSLGTLFVVEGGTAMRRVFHRLGAVLEDPTHPCADASCTEPMWECSHGDAVVHLQILVVPRSRASTPPMELICIFTRGGVLWTCGTTPPFDVVHRMELQMPLHSRSIRAAHGASVFLDRYDGNYSEVLQLTLSEPQHAHDDDDDDVAAAGVKLKALFRIEGRVAGLVHFPPEMMGVLSRVLLSISDSGFADAWNCHTCSEVVLHSDEPLFDLASHGAPSSVLLVHGRVWIGTDRGEIMVLLPRPQSMDGIQMEISLCAREEHAHADGVGGLLCTAMGERVWSWCEVGREAHLWCLADSAAEDSTVQLIRIGSLCFPGSGMCTPICAQRSMHSLLMAVDGGSDRVCRLRCMEIVDQRNNYPPYSWNRLREVVSRFTARMESAEHGERVQESESASGEPPNSPNTNHMNGADDVYEHNLDSLLIQMERSESRLHEFMEVMQKLLHHPTQLHTLHDVVAATTEAQEASATAATKDDASEAVLHVDPHPRSGVPQRIRALISSEELVSERDHLRSHVHALHSDLEDAQQELRHLETQLSNSQALVEAKEKEVVALRRSVAALTAAADVKCSEATTTFELESQLSQCRRVIADLHRKLEHKQHHGSHASNDVCELEDQLHHYQRKESLARNIITCLLNTQNDIFSAINGIHDFQVESESAPQDQDTMLTELRTKLDKLSFLAHKRESEQYPLWVDVRQLLSSGESRAPPTTGDC